MKKTKRAQQKRRQFAIVAAMLVLISLVLSLLRTNSVRKSEVKNLRPKTEASATVVELAMVGDMLPHETITKAAKTADGYNYLSLITPELQNSFQKADLRFCNQEAVAARDLAVRGYPAFNAPVEFSRDINKFGCNLVSIANNHAADQGSAGIKGTLETWDGLQPNLISGSYRNLAESEKLSVVEENGIKVGFTAFNEVNNQDLPNGEVGINMLSDYKMLTQQIKGLRTISDVVIVSVHWGDEDSHLPTTAQKHYAKQIADLGADIIIGTGPHVWQPYQVLERADGGRTHLWNSIGNGLNSQTKQDQLFSGLALLHIAKDKQGSVSVDSPRVLPTYMHYVWGGGVGSTESELLARRDLQWRPLHGSQSLIDQRNDFKTTEQEQTQKLKQYINNDQVKLLDSY